MKEQRRDRFIDPDEVTDITEENKQYLLKKGLLPFVTKYGKVKWIHPTQKGYRLLNKSSFDDFRPKTFKRILDRYIWIISVVAVAAFVIGIGLWATNNLF